jgi:Ca2+-binding RTX toxin-like protein
MSKRMMILVTIVALMVAMFATAAYAATIHGNNTNEALYETPQNDQIYGRGGNDFLDAVEYTGDIDKLYGGRGEDEVSAPDGDPLDVINGGRGEDSCYGDAGDTFVGCEHIN